jgi:hypothetical protein
MWSLSTQGVIAGDEIVDAINALEFEGEAAPHVIEQIEQTKAAAVGLISSGAYGALDDPEIGFHVTIGGHANEGHKPVAGYDDDQGSVHVVQKTIKVEEEPAPPADGGTPATPPAGDAEPEPQGEPPAASEGDAATGGEETPPTPPVASEGEQQ